MYHFQSITDPQQAIVGDGQSLVQNISGRPFRVGTPGFLVPPSGYAVVDDSDPIVQHNLRTKRIVKKQASTNVSVSPAASTKKAKKKKSEIVEVAEEETTEVTAPEMPETEEVQSVEASFSEESLQVVDEIVAQSETVEDIRSEEEELTPKSDSSSL
jgi:hypothetical protein